MKTFNLPKKSIAASATLLCSSLITFNATAATVGNTSQQPVNNTTIATQEVFPQIDTDVTKTLTTSSFSSVITDNNWLNARVYVTLEDTSAVSEVKVFVGTSNGTDILSESTLKRGGSIDFTVPYNSGTWILYAKAVGTGGSATFHIQD